MVKCTTCGADNGKSARFCQDCGARLPDPAVAATTQGIDCAQCGAANREGVGYCETCGESLERADRPSDAGRTIRRNRYLRLGAIGLGAVVLVGGLFLVGSRTLSAGADPASTQGLSTNTAIRVARTQAELVAPWTAESDGQVMTVERSGVAQPGVVYRRQVEVEGSLPIEQIVIVTVDPVTGQAYVSVSR
jgi:hypothetical protein